MDADLLLCVPLWLSYLVLALSLMGPSSSSWGCTARTQRDYHFPLPLSWQDSLCGVCPMLGWINAETGCGLDTLLTASQPSHRAARKRFLYTCVEVKPQMLFLQIVEVPGSDCLHRCLEASLSLGTQPEGEIPSQELAVPAQKQGRLHSWPLSLPWLPLHRKVEADQTGSALSISQPRSMATNLE